MKPLLDNLEKEAIELYNEQSGINYEVAIQLSQAISLKRIADKFTIPVIANFKPEEIERLKEEWEKQPVNITFNE